MTELAQFLSANLAPIMFAALVLCLLLGYPVAFSLAATGLAFALIGIELGLFQPVLLQALPDRLFGIMSNETLLAVPFFTFMGLILERSGMAEDLLDTVGQLFGPVRGGLAFAVILVGALLAATTGVVAASVISMGLISLPIMLRYGYDKRLAAGVIAASGTLAQIIPPSLVLIILADQLKQPVGEMYAGALVPGLALTGAYAAYVAINAIMRPHAVPALPPAARSPRDAVLAKRVAISLLPPLVLIFVVLGTVFMGIASSTVAGAMGAIGALLMALARRRLTLDKLKQALDTTTKLTTFVVFILIGSNVFSLTFRAAGGEGWVEQLFTGLPGGALGFLIVVNLMVFALAFFLDFFELSFIVVPLLAPVAAKLGIDPIWFGVMLAVNMQTSFLHPPFGFALFYLRSVAPPSVRSADIYWGAVPFVLIQLVMVGLVIAFPPIVTAALGTRAKVDVDRVEIVLPRTSSEAGASGDPLTAEIEADTAAVRRAFGLAAPVAAGEPGEAEIEADRRAIEAAFGRRADEPGAPAPAR